MNKRIVKILDSLPNRRILVIGDLMLDKYIWGNVSRISPEAPVQIVHVQEETYAPGGAANCANNISELGGLVTIVGITGDDEASGTLHRELRKRSIVTDHIVRDSTRPTIQKVRMMGHNQQLLRIDYEKTHPPGKETVRKLCEDVAELVGGSDAVVMSDYAKGLLGEQLVKAAIEEANRHNIPTICDFKAKNKDIFRGCTVMLPNYGEACQMGGVEQAEGEIFEQLGQNLVKMMDSSILVTRGEQGVSVFNKAGDVTHLPTKAREVYDVSGAGDTVTAAIALALASGAELEDAAVIANHAAGVVVGKVGTSTATVGEVRASLNKE